MNDNPYAPPASDPRLPDANGRAAPSVKRPASSKWAIAILSLNTVVGFFLQSATSVSLALASIIALYSLLVGERMPWCYYTVTCYLGLLSVRAIWVGYQNTLGTDPLYSAYRDQPVLTKAVSIVGLLLLVLLFVRFALGKPSRRFYQVMRLDS